MDCCAANKEQNVEAGGIKSDKMKIRAYSNGPLLVVRPVRPTTKFELVWGLYKFSVAYHRSFLLFFFFFAIF